uniref:Uncharacterized protein n=1 Tax=Lygus hesperus TaxID=30085 RepID=A0A0K8SCA7_LYGHE
MVLIRPVLHLSGGHDEHHRICCSCLLFFFYQLGWRYNNLCHGTYSCNPAGISRSKKKNILIVSSRFFYCGLLMAHKALPAGFWLYRVIQKEYHCDLHVVLLPLLPEDGWEHFPGSLGHSPSEDPVIPIFQFHDIRGDIMELPFLGAAGWEEAGVSGPPTKDPPLLRALSHLNKLSSRFSASTYQNLSKSIQASPDLEVVTNSAALTQWGGLDAWVGPPQPHSTTSWRGHISIGPLPVQNWSRTTSLLHPIHPPATRRIDRPPSMEGGIVPTERSVLAP